MSVVGGGGASFAVSSEPSARDRERRANRVADDMFVMRQCQRCRAHYREIDNLGLWHCQFHPEEPLPPMQSMPHARAGHFGCCNRPAHMTLPVVGERYADGTHVNARPSLGCTPCDHVSRLDVAHEPPRTIVAADVPIFLVHGDARGIERQPNGDVLVMRLPIAYFQSDTCE